MLTVGRRRATDHDVANLTDVLRSLTLTRVAVEDLRDAMLDFTTTATDDQSPESSARIVLVVDAVLTLVRGVELSIEVLRSEHPELEWPS